MAKVMTDSTAVLKASPHIRGSAKTSAVMRDVIIAALPSAAVGVALFGLQGAVLLIFCVGVCVLSEALLCAVTGRAQQVRDLSAAVTGLLLGMSLPSDTPLHQAAVGCVFAIVLVKYTFGGIGFNTVNPAVAARVMMLLSFGEVSVPSYPDAVSSPTPLTRLAEGEAYSIPDLLLGYRGGAVGEVCAAALIVGGVYLMLRRVITWHIPTAFIVTVFLMSLMYESGDLTLALSWTLSGSVLLGAVFMATDYVTSPTRRTGKTVYGVLCGFLTSVIRLYGIYPEGVSFAILLANLACPLIDACFEKKVFGGGRG